MRDAPVRTGLNALYIYSSKQAHSEQQQQNTHALSHVNTLLLLLLLLALSFFCLFGNVRNSKGTI